jgi:hypothetical protein
VAFPSARTTGGRRTGWARAPARTTPIPAAVARRACEDPDQVRGACRERVAGMAVARQPPQVRCQHRIQRPDPPVVPADLSAGPPGHLELVGIAVLDLIIGSHIDDHGAATTEPGEEVRRVPDPPPSARPAQPERLRDHSGYRRVRVEQHHHVAFKPGLEPDMITSGREPPQARKVKPSQGDTFAMPPGPWDTRTPALIRRSSRGEHTGPDGPLPQIL